MSDNRNDEFDSEDNMVFGEEDEEQWFIEDFLIDFDKFNEMCNIPEIAPGRIKFSDLFKYLDVFFKNYETVYFNPIALGVSDTIRENVRKIVDAYDVDWFERIVVAKNNPTTLILEYKVDYINSRMAPYFLREINDLSDGMTVFMDNDGKHMLLSIYLEDFILVRYKSDKVEDQKLKDGFKTRLFFIYLQEKRYAVQ